MQKNWKHHQSSFYVERLHLIAPMDLSRNSVPFSDKNWWSKGGFLPFLQFRVLPEFHWENSGSGRNSGLILKSGSHRNRISLWKFRFRFYRNRICHSKFRFRLKVPEWGGKKSGSGSGFFYVHSGRSLTRWQGWVVIRGQHNQFLSIRCRMQLIKGGLLTKDFEI